MDLVSSLKKTPAGRAAKKVYWILVNHIFAFVRRTKRKWRERVMDIRAYRNIIAERKLSAGRAAKAGSDKVKKVGFLIGDVTTWNKFELFYKALREDDRFQTFLLCVPEGIVHGVEQDPEKYKRTAFEWFKNNGYAEAIDTFYGNEWLDLKKLELDFIFYGVPYNGYFPKKYHSFNVAAYVKICLIMYGVRVYFDPDATALNRDFFRNLSYYFASSEEARQEALTRYRFAHKLGFLKIYLTGETQTLQILSAKNKEAKAWDFSKNKFRILWTPRWTTDPKLLGSNFFTYKDCLLDFAEKNTDVDILIRPHPLMFFHLEETGEFTEADRTCWMNRINGLSNVSLDYELDYSAAFWQSDMLLADPSSILPEYFVTGKPIVFCKTDTKLKFMNPVRDVVNSSYVAHNADEGLDYIRMLREGRDPKKEERIKKAELLIEDSKQCIERIKKCLVS